MVHFRTLSMNGRRLDAYGLFSLFPDSFSAILEDPGGSGRQFLVSSEGSHAALHWPVSQSDAVSFFDDWRCRLQNPEHSPAIRCLFYAAYEAGLLIERLPDPKSAIPGPVLWTFYPSFSICFDPGSRKIHLAATDASLAENVLAMLHMDMVQPLMNPAMQCGKTHVTSPQDYMQAVQRVKAYIQSGDIFQANIARFWSMACPDEILPALYGNLRRVNPAPFSCFVRIGERDASLQILSSSPERLFCLHADGMVETRPIAGTRRRGSGDEDDALKSELLLSDKERAEHIMLVDLERNDLGKVCVPGSVEVNELMAVERYPTVQHIVSNVRGRLIKGRSVADVFRAMFPGGTITGCPKVRCMQIIHELEPQARGPYTGGVGYAAWDGSADMNILIRSFWHHDGRLFWAAGAGIVADSDPEQELLETEHKVRGLLRAFR